MEQNDSPKPALDMDFKALPKVELHAHLSGSVSRQCLHDIWRRKKEAGQTELEDPLVAMPAGKHDYDLKTFFPLFSSYIYQLLDDAQSLAHATASVLRDFAADGVVYLELRTTPREIVLLGDGGATASRRLTKEQYVRTVLGTMVGFEAAQEGEEQDEGKEEEEKQHGDEDGGRRETLLETSISSSSGGGGGGEKNKSRDGKKMKKSPRLHARLILSIDRRNSLAEARELVALARTFRDEGVVGIDLCGDPRQGGIEALGPAFADAREAGLAITLHFAEAACSGSDAELATLLAWRPDRLGHVIHVSDAVRRAIVSQTPALGLELCLSCNVHAGMVSGGFEGHHFGEWWRVEECVIALSTDDVGVFGSPLSNEYALVARHFRLTCADICRLARGAVEVIFGGEAEKERLRGLMWAE